MVYSIYFLKMIRRDINRTNVLFFICFQIAKICENNEISRNSVPLGLK